MTKTTHKAYVYAIKVNGVRRIIGKGSNGRVHDYMKAMRSADRGYLPKSKVLLKLYAAYKADAKITHTIIEKGLTHRQALIREKHFIAKYRTLYPDQLWNIAAGGNGWALSGAIASALQKQRFANPKERARVVMQLTQQWADPIFRAEKLKQLRSAYAKPTFGAELRRLWATPQFRTKMLAIVKRRNANPRYSAKLSASLTKHFADPKARAHISTQRKRHFANNPKARARIVTQMVQQWNDPEWRLPIIRKIKQTCSDPEFRKRAAEHARRGWVLRRATKGNLNV